jgi:voltage-gated potassium channel
VDLLAILPTLLMWGGVDLRVLRVLRLTRMLRLAKLGRYSKAVQTLGQVVRLKREELILSLVLMLFMLVVASSLMFMVESQQQPEAFSSIPATMWWTVMTLTTVGYGDVFPITTAGKLLASGIAVLGIGLFALPAGLVASAFVELRGRQQPHASTCPHCGKTLDSPPKNQELKG